MADQKLDPLTESVIASSKARRPKEQIGPCDGCGLVDHHLIDGECPTCRAKPVKLTGICFSRIKGRVRESRPLNARLIVQVDSQNNPMITLLPARAVSHG